MISAKKLTGLALATAAAGMFAAAGLSPAYAGDAGKVHCLGVNGCKGKGECKTDKNACKGMNSCKGAGMVSMSAEECKEKGGTVQK
jgi:hypothetical protein